MSVHEATDTTLRSYRRIADSEHGAVLLLSDSSVVAFLVSVMEEECLDNVQMAVETLMIATESAANVRLLTGRREGLAEALRSLQRRLRSTPSPPTLAVRVAALVDRLLTDDNNKGHEWTTTARAGGHGRRFFGSRTARTVTLQLDNLTDKERTAVETTLLAIKGVISIYFDFATARCVVRAKSALTPETIGLAILETKLTSVALITKHDDGSEEETALTEEMALEERELRETTALPEYLPEDAGKWPPSPRSAAQAMVHIDSQHRSTQHGGGWFGHVASFIAHTLW